MIDKYKRFTNEDLAMFLSRRWAEQTSDLDQGDFYEIALNGKMGYKEMDRESLLGELDENGDDLQDIEDTLAEME